MSDPDWAKILREIATELAPWSKPVGGSPGRKKEIKMLLDAADMIDRAPPTARRRIAQALRIRHPKLTALPRFGAPCTVEEIKGFSPYPDADDAIQAEIVLGRTPAEITGLTAREAHEYLSGRSSHTFGPARWLLKDSPGAMLGITSVPVARWYLQRLKDPAQKDALMKEHVERGPAGEEIRGRFIDRMDELVESDLMPSVRKTFENASNRLRIEFEKEMLRPKNQQRLAPKPAWYKEMPGIMLLDHGAQLVMEGREMRHCVATYIGKVRKGLSTILSIRVPTEDGRVLRSTAELRPSTAEVIQHRGVGNAPPPEPNTMALAHALEVWLKPMEEEAKTFWSKVAAEREATEARHRNPVPADLHARIARDLGWSVEDTYRFSLPTLRELVRDYDLKGDITTVLLEGHHLTQQAPRRRRR